MYEIGLLFSGAVIPPKNHIQKQIMQQDDTDTTNSSSNLSSIVLIDHDTIFKV